MKESGFSNYLETSAKTGSNVKALFDTIAKHLYLKTQESKDPYDDFETVDMSNRASIKLNRRTISNADATAKEMKKGCCK